MSNTVTLELSLSEAAQAANALNDYANRLDRQKVQMDKSMLASVEDEIYKAHKLHADIVREIEKTFRPNKGPQVTNVITR